jgi:hypothetical protein
MKVLLSIVFGLIICNGFSQSHSLLKNQERLLSKSINCIDAGDYALWVGSDKGINRVELVGDSISEVTARQTTKPVLSLYNDGKFLWVGIGQKGLYLFDKKTYEFQGKFKKQLGISNIVAIDKKNDQILIFTDEKEAYAIKSKGTRIDRIPTTDSLIKWSSTKYTRSVANANKISILDSVSFKNNLYELSIIGLIVTKGGVVNPFVKDTVVATNMTDVLVDSVSDKTIVESSKEAKPNSNVPVQKLNENCSDWLSYLWVLVLALGCYTFIVIKLISFKFKKDIKILEDELLKAKR